MGKKLRRKRFLCLATVVVALTFLWNCSVFNKTPKKAQNTPPPAPEETPVIQILSNEEQEAAFEEENNQANKESVLQEDVINQESEEKEKKVEKETDPGVILEEALYAYQDAQLAWDKGDPDTALVALDEAYSLILRLHLPPDDPLIQEKNELRLMIAQRIQEIFAYQETAVGNNHQSIP